MRGVKSRDIARLPISQDSRCRVKSRKRKYNPWVHISRPSGYIFLDGYILRIIFYLGYILLRLFYVCMKTFHSGRGERKRSWVILCVHEDIFYHVSPVSFMLKNSSGLPFFTISPSFINQTLSETFMAKFIS